jgi:hypothetical protein
VRLDQVATAAAAPKADGTKKQPNIFAAFGAKVPAKKSKEIELREKKDTAALLSPGVRLYSASLPASSKKRKHELGINDVAVNTDVSDRQKRLWSRTNRIGLCMPILESSWLSIKRSSFYAQARASALISI